MTIESNLVNRTSRDRVRIRYYCNRPEQREERDYDYYGPYYGQPHRQRSPEGGATQEESRLFSHDLKRVRWP
jgi:hypothetical protein